MIHFSFWRENDANGYMKDIKTCGKVMLKDAHNKNDDNDDDTKENGKLMSTEKKVSDLYHFFSLLSYEIFTESR